MKIFVAGATGVMGQRLIPLLIRSGHAVTGMTRSPEKVDQISSAGAEPVIADALDRPAVLSAIERVQPEVIVHQLTAIPSDLNLRHLDQHFAPTNQLRTEGTDNLMAAAVAVKARRFVAQSFAGWPYARTDGTAKTEDDPLDSNPPEALRRSLEALRHLEKVTTGTAGIEGVVLRYGAFYGPGNTLSRQGAMLEQVRRRRIPIIGGGRGVWSFVHIDDAARATLIAIERAAPGIYNIVDDEPAPVREWLPFLASAAGAKPPWHLPAWIGRLAIGEHGVAMMTQVRGASNAKAKSALNWYPVWATYRKGFRRAL